MKKILEIIKENPITGLIHLLTLCLFTGYLIIILSSFRDYGVSWDEYYRRTYGEEVVNYYFSFFQMRSFLDNEENIKFGALFDASAAIIYTFFLGDAYETRHLLNALVGFAGVLGVFFLAKHISRSNAVGLGASLFLIVSPRYYGHSFNNPKDIPFAVFYLFSIFGIIRSIPFWDNERLPPGKIIFLGLSLGALASIRIPGIFVFLFLVLGFWIFQIHLIVSRKTTPSASLSSFISNCIYPFVIASGMIFIFWPYAHIPFLGHSGLNKSLEHLADFKWASPVLFEGEFLSVDKVPWYYLLKWFLITTPLTIIIGLVSFLVLQAIVPATRRIRGKRGKNNDQQLFYYGILLVSLAIPYLYSLFNKSVLYDGIRHFLFFFPMIAILSASGYSALYKFLKPLWISKKQGSRVMPLVFISSIFLLLVPAIKWQIDSHPNQYIYFNEIFGGSEKALGNYDLDYYGNSLREAALWVDKHVSPVRQAKKVSITTNAHPVQVMNYLNHDKFEFTLPQKKRWDIYIWLDRWGERPRGQVVYTVKTKGIPLGRIITRE